MTSVLVHLVLHCVFSAGPLKVARSAYLCAHAQYVIHCTSTMCKSGSSTYFTTPQCECTERAQVHVRHGKEHDDIYGMAGPKVKPWGSRGQTKRASQTKRARYSVPYLTQRSKVKPRRKSRGQTKHDRHSVPYLAQRSKVKKCARTRPALTTPDLAAL